MKRVMLQVIILFALAFSAQAAVRNVFFADGQSNAKQVWGDAIANGLKAGYGSNLVMVWTNHSGEALSNWYTTEPKTNYSNDLYNAAGTGLLQAQMQALVDAGDEPVFQGFFWFQGESDTGSNTAGYATMDAYTNRFQSMLSLLKSDMGFTNDVRFGLAIIDANTNYLAALIASGRDMACVDYLRARQIEMSSTPQGCYVDTRGYVRPSDVWHLSTDELTRLGGNMAAAFTNAFGISLPPGEVIEIASHDADGAIYPTGIFNTLDLICGTAGNPNTTPFNGIAFFQLPANRIETADLAFTVSASYGTWATIGANLDVWCLGYMTAPLMSKDWLLMDDADTRLLLNNCAPVKIADNLLPAGQTPATGSVWQLNGAQRTNLVTYLNSLYAQGAQPGDYVVVRVNPDAAIATGGVSVRFGGSGTASTTKLLITLSDAFATDGYFKYYSNAADGCLNGSSVMNAQDLISGTGGASVDFSGVAFLSLPEQPMSDASLALTVQVFSGVMSGANIDLWGLGYQTTPAMSMTWFCTNDVDDRVLLNGAKPVKLADNIVTSGQTVAVGNIWTPSAAQGKAVLNYLNGLYNRGAKPGDFAVFRMNLDSTQAGASRGVRWGGSHQTNPDRRASLTGMILPATNYLTNASFELGTGTTPANWAIAGNGFLGQRTNVSVRSGSYVYRMAVNGDQSGNSANNLNLAQDVYSPDFAGRIATMSGWARHDTVEALVSNSSQKVEFRIYWLGSTITSFITSSTVQDLLPTDLRDQYKPIFISGVVPPDATGLRAQVIFRTGTVDNPAITTGSAIIDDLRLTVFNPIYPPGTLLLVQ